MHIAQRKVSSATSPEQRSSLVSSKRTGGPPPAQKPGFSKTSAGTQAPSTQPLPSSQTSPQAPQLLLSVWKSTQLRSQMFSPGRHSSLQKPPEQASDSPQEMPQPPQLSGSVLGLVHCSSQIS